jgi:hypothetical protein
MKSLLQRLYLSTFVVSVLLAPTLATASTTAQASINPFTGLPISSGANRPILIKLSNEAAVRPQTGLSLADVVVENYAEGGVTRLNALYLTSLPDKVGSVRSCRLIDIELPVIFDSGLLCSGTSPGVWQLMQKGAAYLDDRTMINNNGKFEGCPTCPLFRTRDLGAPHNLFGSATKAMAVLQSRGKNQPSAFRSWQFNPAAPSAGAAASAVSIPYAASKVGWQFDGATGLWNRTMSNAPHLDRATRKQLTASNVLVIFAHHQPTLIVEDRTGSRSIQIQLWGEGPLKVFRDGRVIDGRWRRSDQPGVLELLDAEQSTIALKPGVTWIQLVPVNFGVSVRP